MIWCDYTISDTGVYAMGLGGLNNCSAALNVQCIDLATG